jgi:hypothetical protein
MINSTLHFPKAATALFEPEKTILEEITSAGLDFARSLLVSAIRFAEALFDGGTSIYDFVTGQPRRAVVAREKRLPVVRGDNDILE